MWTVQWCEYVLASIADPVIKSAPSHQEFNEGTDVLIACVVNLGNPKGHILWTCGIKIDATLIIPDESLLMDSLHMHCAEEGLGIP